jgi:hypothetical protein
MSSLASIRAAAQRAVDESSLREVAQQIPMSWAALRNFLNGSTPHRATIGKLAAWYRRYRHGATKEIPRGEIDAAIGILSSYIASGIDESTRRKRRSEITDRLP